MIKLTFTEEEKKPDYPCVKKSPDCTVLFFDECEGIVINGGNSWDTGHYSKGWHMPAFTNVHGKMEF